MTSRENTSSVRWRSRYSSMSRLTNFPERAASSMSGRSRATASSTVAEWAQGECGPRTAETLMDT